MIIIPQRTPKIKLTTKVLDSIGAILDVGTKGGLRISKKSISSLSSILTNSYCESKVMYNCDWTSTSLSS